LGEVSAAVNRAGATLAAAPVQPRALAGLLRRVSDRTLSGALAREVFGLMWDRVGAASIEADTIIAERGLTQVSDVGAIEALVDGVIAAHPAIVAEFRAGKEKAFNALVGQVMKASHGKANPAEVNAALRRRLA
jgi:aspartyl-tRNA(Asn)/glutamyl-tRNA(Gln) amidotransferase subunit B